jgi:hypothetical protein
LHRHLECISIDTVHPAPAGSSTDDANPQLIAGGAAQDFANMQKPSARKSYAIFSDEVFTFEQQVIQIVTEWLSLPGCW